MIVGPISSSLVLGLSYVRGTLCCPVTFSPRLCHLEAHFLELFETTPSTLNVGASGSSYLVTLGLGLWLRFDFVSFCKSVS